MRKLLITMLLFALPVLVLAQEVELSHNSSSQGSHFSEAKYGAKFGTLGLSAKYKSEPLGKFYKIGAINDFDMDGTRCFYFGSGVVDQVSDRSYADIGAGLYIINGERFNLSVAGLLRKTEYLTSVRSRLSLVGGQMALRNVITYFPEIRLVENNLRASLKLSEKSTLGYSCDIIGDRATDKLYLKFKF